MTKAATVLIALLTLCLVGPPAAAAGSTGASASADGRTTLAGPPVANAFVAAKPPAKVESLKEIYSSFGPDRDNLYDCCIAWTLTTRESVVGLRQFVAAPFTPADNGSIRKIVVALSWVSGLNALTVSLRADDGGLPGAVIKRFELLDLPVFGGCCETETLAAKGIPVTAGTTYWVTVRAAADTWAGWNFNVLNLPGPFAVKSDWLDDTGHWQLNPNSPPAFRVLGE
jgi:hypothetical protein